MQTLTMLPPPKNQMAHLLREMIEGKYVAEQNYQYNRFRGTISDLRLEHNVPIHHIDKPFTNTFGRKSQYREHFILSVDIDEAIKVYEKINL